MHRQLIKMSAMITLITVIGLLFSSTALAATSPKGVHTSSTVHPYDRGGGCSGTKTQRYSGLTVSISACTSTNPSNVNGDGYVSLNASSPSKWALCSVAIYTYSTSNSGSPIDSWVDTCFSSPQNFNNRNFGEASAPKSSGSNYYTIVEVIGTYNRINVAVVQQSPTQCVGLFC